MTRLSNHPDFVGITLVLIDKLNPEDFLYDYRNTYVFKITITIYRAFLRETVV